MTPHLSIVEANSYDILREILQLENHTPKDWVKRGTANLHFMNRPVVKSEVFVLKSSIQHNNQRMMDALNMLHSVEKCRTWSYY